MGPVSRDSMLYIEVVIALLEYIHYNFMYKMYIQLLARKAMVAIKAGGELGSITYYSFAANFPNLHFIDPFLQFYSRTTSLKISL